MSYSNCWVQDVNVQKQLEYYFADVDRGFSTYYEANPNTGEPQLDGHLAARLERESVDSLPLYLRRIERERINAGLKPLRLSFTVKHITSEEKKHGADIGLVARVEAPGEYILTKAVLVQAKRLYPSRGGVFSESSIYRELFKHRKDPQWERMLKQTPASVYFLYNPYQIHLKRRIRILGTRVISAQQIAGMAHRGATRFFTALSAYQTGKPLAEWLVEDFICCRIGDTHQKAINTALGKNPDFPVRWAIVTTIESRGD